MQIKGRVSRAGTDTPIAQAEVSLRVGESILGKLYTDAQGAFYVGDASEALLGQMLVCSVTADGYEPATRTRNLDVVDITLDMELDPVQKAVPPPPPPSPPAPPPPPPWWRSGWVPAALAVTVAVVVWLMTRPECRSDRDCSGNRVCMRGDCVTQAPAQIACGSSSDCPGGQRCEHGRCQAGFTYPDCGTTVDCPGGEVCQGGRCQSSEPPGPSPVIMAAWNRMTGEDCSYGCGSRSLYKVLRSSVDAIVELSGERVFESGQNPSAPSLYSHSTFGRYNPEFVEWASAHLIVGAHSDALRRRTQSIYDSHLRVSARSFQLALLLWRGNPALFNQLLSRYRAALGNGDQLNAIRRRYCHMMASHVDEQGGDYLNGYTAACFWLRRGLDGTKDEFEAALRKLLQTYDSDWCRGNRCAAP